jgi:hypothetical protein
MGSSQQRIEMIASAEGVNAEDGVGHSFSMADPLG